MMMKCTFSHLPVVEIWVVFAEMCRYLIKVEAGNVTRPSAAPFSPQVL